MNAATMRWSGNSSDMGRGQGTCRTAVSILVTFIGLSYFGPNTSIPTRPALTARASRRSRGESFEVTVVSLQLGRLGDDARSFEHSRLLVGRVGGAVVERGAADASSYAPDPPLPRAALRSCLTSGNAVSFGQR